MILLFLFLCNSYHIHEIKSRVAIKYEIQMKFLFYFSFLVSVMYKKSFKIKITNWIISQTYFYVSAKIKKEVRDS